MHSAEQLLNRLEKTTQHNESWVEYVAERSGEIKEWIAKLRKFAAIKAGPVSDSCNDRANQLEVRLNKILEFRGKL